MLLTIFKDLFQHFFKEEKYSELVLVFLNVFVPSMNWTFFNYFYDPNEEFTRESQSQRMSVSASTRTSTVRAVY